MRKLIANSLYSLGLFAGGLYLFGLADIMYTAERFGSAILKTDSLTFFELVFVSILSVCLFILSATYAFEAISPTPTKPKDA